MAAAGLAVAILSLVIGTVVGYRQARAERLVRRPELIVDGIIQRREQSTEPFSVSVHLLQGQMVARDVEVVVRMGYNFWHCHCGDIGPARPTAKLEAVRQNVPGLLEFLPRRPFLDNATAPFGGDAAVVVTWVFDGYREWWGHQQKPTGPGSWEWSIDGPVIRGRFRIKKWHWRAPVWGRFGFRSPRERV